MIVGVGVDIVDLARFRDSLARTPTLAERLFTEAERVLPLPSLAARFAAKEALAKALRCPDGLQWQDAEILPDGDGAPVLTVRGSVADAAARLGVRSWHLSLAHERDAAVAVVVAQA